MSGLDAVKRQISEAGAALSDLRRLVDRAVTINQEAQEATVPLQFRMEGTGRKVLGKLTVVDSKLNDVLELVDSAVDDLLDLEEALES